MILVDTNVISEPLRPKPSSQVVAWLDHQPLETLFLSAITVAELRFGIAALPAGKRRTRLGEDFEQRVLPLFLGRILPFDLYATQAYAELMARARTAGRAIAATASANGLTVATRDTAPFAAAGVSFLDPWNAPA